MRSKKFVSLLFTYSCFAVGLLLILNLSILVTHISQLINLDDRVKYGKQALSAALLSVESILLLASFYWGRKSLLDGFSQIGKSPFLEKTIWSLSTLFFCQFLILACDLFLPAQYDGLRGKSGESFGEKLALTLDHYAAFLNMITKFLVPHPFGLLTLIILAVFVRERKS